MDLGSLYAWRYAGRALIFTVLLAFMAWGPFSRQVLHSGNDLFRPWIMFKGIAVGAVDARFYRHWPDGRRELLDRYEILGYDNWWHAPKALRHLRGRGKALAMGRVLCTRLGSDADVRVVSRIATRQGWKKEQTDTWNVCQSAGEDR